MEKHPVDELFSKKLHALERQPSAGTWARLSASKNKPERKLFSGWVWYAAAGIFLALISGYSVWQNEKPASSTESGPMVSKVNSVKDPVQKAVVTDEPNATVKKTEGFDPIRFQEAKQIASKGKEEHQGQATFTPGNISPPVKENHLPILPTDTLAEVQVASVQPSLIKEVQPMVIPEVKSANRTIVVNVTVGNDTLEQPKASRFTRVFRQLKNVRAGEPVNWDEVGFDPRSVLARVDGKHKQGQ